MKKLTPLRAIRSFCLDCCGSAKEVESCTANPGDISLAAEAGDETAYQGCVLYEFRHGHNPARRGHGGKGNSAALKKFRELNQCPQDSTQSQR